MDEKQFSEKIRSAELTEREIDVLREDLGLKPNHPTDTNPVLRKRIQLQAWSKLPQRCANPKCNIILPSDHPAVYCSNECAIEDV